MENEFRQPNRFDLMSPVEKAITELIWAIEKMEANVNLTNAQIKLGEARDLVYEYYKELSLTPSPRESISSY